MSVANIYGPIVSAAQVEKALVASLGIWLDSALGELERVDGYPPGQIQRPLGIITGSEFEKWPEDQIPVVVAINTGLNGKPEKHSDGLHNAAWAVGIAAIVSDLSQPASRALAHTYGAAIRMAVLQHRMLKSPAHPGGFATYISWENETYHDLTFDKTRTLASANVLFSVGVNDVVTESGGPRTPPIDPLVDPGPWTPVVEVLTPIIKEPIV